MTTALGGGYPKRRWSKLGLWNSILYIDWLNSRPALLSNSQAENTCNQMRTKGEEGVPIIRKSLLISFMDSPLVDSWSHFLQHLRKYFVSSTSYKVISVCLMKKARPAKMLTPLRKRNYWSLLSQSRLDTKDYSLAHAIDGIQRKWTDSSVNVPFLSLQQNHQWDLSLSNYRGRRRHIFYVSANKVHVQQFARICSTISSLYRVYNT